MRLLKWGSDLLLYALALFFLFPLYWMITGSFKNQTTAIKMPPDIIPLNPTIANYKQLMATSPIFEWLLNSVIVAGIATAFTCLVATMAGYALTKKNSEGRD